MHTQKHSCSQIHSHSGSLVLRYSHSHTNTLHAHLHTWSHQYSNTRTYTCTHTLACILSHAYAFMHNHLCSQIRTLPAPLMTSLFSLALSFSLPSNNQHLYSEVHAWKERTLREAQKDRVHQRSPKSPKVTALKKHPHAPTPSPTHLWERNAGYPKPPRSPRPRLLDNHSRSLPSPQPTHYFDNSSLCLGLDAGESGQGQTYVHGSRQALQGPEGLLHPRLNI